MSGWSDYIDIYRLVPAERRATISRSLDDIWATQEGRDLIMRAYQGNLDTEGNPLKITIFTESDTITRTEREQINLNFDHIAVMRFRNADGSYRATSVTETLVHELIHAADTRDDITQVLTAQAQAFLGPHLRTQPAATPEQIYAISREFVARFAASGNDFAASELERFSQQILSDPMSPEELAEYHMPLISMMTGYVNRLPASDLAEIAQEVGLQSIRIRPEISLEESNTAFIRHVTEMRSISDTAEGLAVSFTDYFMLKHFGVEPRQTPDNGDFRGQAQDLSRLPSRRWAPDWDLGESGRERVAQEAQEYNRDALGRLDVPILPYKTLRTLERE